MANIVRRQSLISLLFVLWGGGDEEVGRAPLTVRKHAPQLDRRPTGERTSPGDPTGRGGGHAR